MLTELQKLTAQAVVNVFETGRARGEYGKVTLLAGDPGHLTYGRSQTTLASGNLHLCVRDYCRQPDALLGDELADYLPRLAQPDFGLDHDRPFIRLLREAGDDPVMQRVQDAFFDRVYWRPATASAATLGIRSPLGTAVVYDGRVHGSWPRMRDRTNEQHGAIAALGEQAWVRAYVGVRRDWLANHSIEVLRRTVYRMEAFERMFADEAWDLPLPLRVRGVLVDESVLAAPVPVRASAEVGEERHLRLRSPMMQGDDVRAVQAALAASGAEIEPDGLYGPTTEAAVVAFQRSSDLTVDGIVGPATRSALGL